MVMGETTPKGGFGSPFTWMGGGFGDPLGEALRSCPGPPQYNHVPESRPSFAKRVQDLHGPWLGCGTTCPSPAPVPSPVSAGNESTVSDLSHVRDVAAMLTETAVARQSTDSQEVVTIDGSLDASEVQGPEKSFDFEAYLESPKGPQVSIQESTSYAQNNDANRIIKDSIWGDDTVDTRNLIRQAASTSEGKNFQTADKPPMSFTPGKSPMPCPSAEQEVPGKSWVTPHQSPAVGISVVTPHQSPAVGRIGNPGSPAKFFVQNWSSRSPKRSASHLEKENEAPHTKLRLGNSGAQGMSFHPNKNPAALTSPCGPQPQCEDHRDMVPRQHVEDVAYERDFYFAKLRRVEALCDMYQEQPSLFAGVGLTQSVIEALYCSEDPGEIPRYPVNC